MLQPHIQLSEEINVQYALLPGDPARVDRVKPYLVNTEAVVNNREYKGITGYYQDIKLLVLSTGMGGPSTGIAVEELAKIGVKTLIRIGSCGALQDDMCLGSLVIATGAVRDEGTTESYIPKGYPAIADPLLIQTLKSIADQHEFDNFMGLVRSHDSFYTDREEEIDAFWSQKGILGADMETAALYVIGSLRGLQTASILNVVVTSKGNLTTGINDFVHGESLTREGEKRQIKVALEAIASIHHK